ncbi:phosphoenolpyruvate--protein phosphotransferase [Geobacter sp. SVR]|uniref:phosphoenolpyruvate--protein phosphotransferase n=1 Tax=Geobacter sp. SVR TaxID=2495594 RepID=UPI00143F0497|nr:phosphoenolpyruvate--protein phosphotransferase [Geobacter sp. SVR]BCS53474.1 phosphoenolpyruvate-protein phosphotransferase [Geobacter sp. SVR]GCF85399.1 phosphoenolpyruvate-protein phosphotransferase [Geobacter sp. SVR]
MQLFHGIAVSPGIAVGRLRVVDRRRVRVEEYEIAPAAVDAEVERLQNAVERTRSELTALRDQLRQTTGEEHLFFIETHLMILSDERLSGETASTIRTGLINAEGALRRTLHKYREIFAGIEDAYLRERISDVETVIEKILRNMAGKKHAPIVPEVGQTVIAAHDISPADILQMDRDRVIGMVTEIGGKTSHASILARAFELPAVAGVEGVTDVLLDGAPVILDGLRGELIVNPDQTVFLEYLQRKRHYEYMEFERLKLAALPAETQDGRRITLRGNVEVPEEGASVLRHGGEGAGLYRTEMLFMNRPGLPDEEEQYRIYVAMQQAVAPHMLTIRTLDLGGDKLLNEASGTAEQNPALGVRAIRLALNMPDEFRKQLRAILRTSAAGPVRIMFPMISGLEELRRALALLDEARRELDSAGMAHDRAIKVGIMIEVPSAVVVADLLAREVDFFSVGTNDLIQYTLAIDRSNENLENMFHPLHPAILRSLRRIVEVAHEAGIEACICGEMAGDPLYLPVLLGLGFDELSMAAASIPRVKQVLRRCTMDRVAEIAEGCFSFATAGEAELFLKRAITRHFAESFD